MDVLEQVQRKGAGTVEKLAVLRLKVQKFAAFDPGKQRLQPFDRGGGQHAFVAQRIANLACMSLQFRGGVSKQRGQRPQREFHLGASHVGTSIIGLRGERLAPPNRFALLFPLLSSLIPQQLDPRRTQVSSCNSRRADGMWSRSS